MKENEIQVSLKDIIWDSKQIETKSGIEVCGKFELICATHFFGKNKVTKEMKKIVAGDIQRFLSRVRINTEK